VKKAGKRKLPRIKPVGGVKGEGLGEKGGKLKKPSKKTKRRLREGRKKK